MKEIARITIVVSTQDRKSHEDEELATKEVEAVLSETYVWEWLDILLEDIDNIEYSVS